MNICFVALGNSRSPNLRPWLVFMANRGHAVHLISHLPVQVPGVRTHAVLSRCSFSKLFYLYSFPFVRSTVKAIQPELTVAYYASGNGFIGALLDYHPLVVTAEGSDVLVQPNKSEIMRHLLKFALKQADLVIAAAPHIAPRLEELGVDKDAVLTMPRGIDLDFFSPNPRRSDTKPGPVIISTRRLDAKYRIDALLRTFAFVVAEESAAELIIAGDGFASDRKALEQLAHSLDISHSVRFVGALSQQEVLQYLRQADLYASLSLSDGTSASLLEAMAVGLFPVVMDMPASRDWVVDGQNGLLLSTPDPEKQAQQILRVYRDRKLIQNARSHNRRLVEERADVKKNLGQIAERLEQLRWAESPATRIGL